MHYRTADVVEAITQLTRQWGVSPTLRVSCIGSSDEHIQLYHPDDYSDPDAMPHLVIDDSGVSLHPDTNR